MSNADRIRSVVEKVAKREVDIGDEESLFDSGILDSFAFVDVVGEIEQEFNVKIPDSDLNFRKFSSISKIESYLAGLNQGSLWRL